MTFAEARSRISAREMMEWQQFLSLTDDDLKKPATAEDQVKSVFRRISG